MKEALDLSSWQITDDDDEEEEEEEDVHRPKSSVNNRITSWTFNLHSLLHKYGKQVAPDTFKFL